MTMKKRRRSRNQERKRQAFVKAKKHVKKQAKKPLRKPAVPDVDAEIEAGRPPIIVMGYTLSMIAQAVGKTSGYLARCLRRNRQPSLETLGRLQAFLKLDSLDATAELFAPQAAAEAAASVAAAVDPQQS